MPLCALSLAPPPTAFPVSSALPLPLPGVVPPWLLYISPVDTNFQFHLQSLVTGLIALSCVLRDVAVARCQCSCGPLSSNGTLSTPTVFFLCFPLVSEAVLSTPMVFLGLPLLSETALSTLSVFFPGFPLVSTATLLTTACFLDFPLVLPSVASRLLTVLPTYRHFL